MFLCRETDKFKKKQFIFRYYKKITTFAYSINKEQKNIRLITRIFSKKIINRIFISCK